MENCVFCKIVRKEIPAKIVYENENFFAIIDANPITPGHTLVIPKKHFKTILDMPLTLGNEMLEIVKKVAFDLIKQNKAEGFNIIINTYKVAGQEVPHIHIHIIPRKKEDKLKIF